MQCQLISKFFDVLDALTNDKKAPRDYGKGSTLYHAELNLLNMIYKYPDFNAIELSYKMGITRGAVTQISNKLEEKTLIERYFREGNKKAKYYKLTSLGEEIRIGHVEYHANANDKMCEYLRSLSKEEMNIIINFLDKTIDLMPISEFECRYHLIHNI